MIDFNNPYLTLQQKQDILSSIAQGHKMKQLTKEDAANAVISFGSCWNITMRDLWNLNTMGKQKLNTTFMMNQEQLETYFPDFSVVLFESDRIEKGEWDDFEGKWAPIGYQHTLVIGYNGVVMSIEQQKCLVAHYTLDAEYKQNQKYTATQDKIAKGHTAFSLGLLDIPLDDLADYEHRRVYAEIDSPKLTKVYQKTLDGAMNNILPSSKKKNSRQFNKRGFGY
jgi:hypothetical protein